MTNRWLCHGNIAGISMMLAGLALAACSDDRKSDDLADSRETCGCADLGNLDATEPRDSSLDEAAAPADAPIQQDHLPDIRPDDAQIIDLPTISDTSADLSNVDILTQDLTPADPGRPPASLGIVSPADLISELASKDFLLVNVHIPNEGQIPQTDRHISYLEIDALTEYLGTDLDVKTVVYCLSNYMSTIAGNDLVTLGYRNVRYLDGGMSAWKSKGYPFENL